MFKKKKNERYLLQSHSMSRENHTICSSIFLHKKVPRQFTYYTLRQFTLPSLLLLQWHFDS